MPSTGDQVVPVNEDVRSIKPDETEIEQLNGNLSIKPAGLSSRSNDSHTATLKAAVDHANNIAVSSEGPGLSVVDTLTSEAPFVEYDNFRIYYPRFATLAADGSVVPVFSTAQLGTTTAVLPSPGTTPASNGKNVLPGALGSAASGPVQQFVVTGDIQLFGHIHATCEVYRTVNQLQPYAEIVRLTKSEVCLSSLIPDLRDTAFDSIALDKPRFCYSEFSFNDFEPAGVYFETDILFRGALQPVSDVLRNTFHQTHPALHFSTYLGGSRDWTRPWPVTDFVLSGSLGHISVHAFDVLTFTQLGVEVSAYGEVDYTAPRTAWSFDYGFFGSLHLHVPGSVVPLQATYHLRKLETVYSLTLSLKDDEWNEVFGIKGLNLSSVQLNATLSDLSQDTQLSLIIGAELLWNNTPVAVWGFYSKGSYSLEAYIGPLSLKELGGFVKRTMGIDLGVFEYDVVFDSMYLRATHDGLTLGGAITINGHSTADGLIKVSRDGVAISGDLPDVKLEEFEVRNAQLDAFIGSQTDKSSHRATTCTISGNVSLCGINFKTKVHTERGADGNMKWTINGEPVTKSRGGLSTASLCPALKRTFLDVQLSNLALIATNHDNSASAGASHNKHNYPVDKGIQFCAVIESIPVLEKILRTSVKGIILQAPYVNNLLSLRLLSPAPRTLRFGVSVWTGPLSFDIQTGNDIQLSLAATLNVRVSSQPDPLSFNLGLKADITDAAAYGQMTTDWANPCSIGKNVTIRGGALEFGIVYATFLETGLPGEMGFAGKLSIGKKEVSVAMKVSENPKEQLLSASVKDLNIEDLIEFASIVAGHDFPQPKNFLQFTDAQLYISTGMSIGLTSYPPGTSMKGDMHILGNRAQFDCTVGQLIKLKATIETFSVGALSVQGAAGPNPSVDVELSATKQSILIDGKVSIWGTLAATHLNGNFYPSPSFDLWIDFKLSDLFLLKLDVLLVGNVDFTDLKTLENADLGVHGQMEQRVIDYITKQLDKQLDAATRSANEGFDNVKKDLDAYEAAYKAGCDVAEKKLEEQRVRWYAEQARASHELDTVKTNAHNTLVALQGKVDETERAWNAVVAQANQQLELARHNAAANINAAQTAVAFAQEDSDNSIRGAQDAVQRAKDAYYRQFGNAESQIENARNNVNNAQLSLNSINERISGVDANLNNTPAYRVDELASFGAQRVALTTEQGAAYAALQTVQGILFGAEEVVKGTGYVTAEGAIGAAQATLEGVRQVKSAALIAANASLEAVKETQDASVRAAEAAVNEAKTASDQLHVFDMAKAALAAGEKHWDDMINTAQGQLNALANCTEKVAFDVAEKALAAARNNTSELTLAKHAVDVAQGAENVALNMAKYAEQHAGRAYNLREVVFDGSLKGLVASGPPITVTVKGVVMARPADIQVVWKPGFDLVEFIKELFTRVWELVQEGVRDIFG